MGPEHGAGVGWCPMCGTGLPGQSGFVTEYWKGEDRWFLTWCSGCSTTTLVCLPTRITATEPEH